MASIDQEIDSGFLATILTPGSTLHPTFLFIVDVSFVFLVLILIALLVVTRSAHFIALMLITLGLWASVKWFVSELKTVKAEEAHATLSPSLLETKRTT